MNFSEQKCEMLSQFGQGKGQRNLFKSCVVRSHNLDLPLRLRLRVRLVC